MNQLRLPSMIRRAMAIAALAVVALSACSAADNPRGVWTDPKDPSLPADFKIQGEYSFGKDSDKTGCQVIALGNGKFQAVLFTGGLPGDGWDGKNRSLLQGKLDGDKAVFEPASGKRNYLAQSPDEFSATEKFPPAGNKPYIANADGEEFCLKESGRGTCLRKTERKSDTIGKKPPEGAIVLFDGSSKDEWNGGRVDEKTKLLNTDGRDIVTKRKFNNYTMHLEFLLPYRPDGRGQGRGNSGFYQVDHYEVQILDSFGLEGKDNECAGVYTKLSPSVNMCLPPLVWQTYDVDFTNAVRDESGKKVKNAVITLKHNGVVVHDKKEITGPTGGHRSDPEGTPGPIKLQGHGNPLQFRNVWIVESR
jgi:3-keto-disaccharide hydrolase